MKAIKRISDNFTFRIIHVNEQSNTTNTNTFDADGQPTGDDFSENVEILPTIMSEMGNPELSLHEQIVNKCVDYLFVNIVFFRSNFIIEIFAIKRRFEHR